MIDEEAQARNRYFILIGVRIGSIACLILGLMIARTVIDGPYALGVVMAVGGMLAFFFAPPLLAKRWKAGDRGER